MLHMFMAANTAITQAISEFPYVMDLTQMLIKSTARRRFAVFGMVARLAVKHAATGQCGKLGQSDSDSAVVVVGV